MPLLRAQRVLNSIEAGTTNAAALETLLADAGRLAEFRAMLTQRSHILRAFVSNTAYSAILGSPSAMGALLAEGSAYSWVFANYPALDTKFTADLLTTGQLNTMAGSAAYRSLIGVGGASESVIYARIKNSHAAVAKFMYGHAGLAPSTVASTLDVWNASSNMTTLSNAKDGIRFAMYSSIVGMLDRDTTNTAGLMTPNGTAPVTITNDAALCFLTLGWGVENISTPVSLSGVGGSTLTNVSSVTLTNADASLGGSCTFAKIVGTAEAGASANMRVGRIKGSTGGIQSTNGGTTPYMLGIIGIACI